LARIVAGFFLPFTQEPDSTIFLSSRQVQPTMKKILKFLGIILLLLVAIVLINTFRFSHPLPKKTALSQPPIDDSAIAHMQEAIRIPTISYADTIAIDTAAYLRFRQFLETAYPLVHQKLNRQIFEHFSYLFTWKGTNPALKPYVLMAHTDVVPVEASTMNKWTHAPFGGELADEQIWGRGAADDKGSAITILEAVEGLLRKNFTPERTIYLSFGHDEEIIGGKGARSIVKWFKENNIRPEMVLDEGGEITLEQFPGLKRPIAAIGVAEKGYLSFELSVEKTGGHSSMPENETAIDILTKALVKLREKQMPYHVTTPMADLLSRIGPGLPFLEKMAISNQWLFGPMLRKKFESDHVTNSLFHTTIVPTIIETGVKDNVIPTRAVAIVNCRNLPVDKQEDVIAFMKKQIGDERIQIKPFKANGEASPITATDGPAFKKVEDVAYKVMPDVIPVPYLLMGGTDSKHFSAVSDGVLKFVPSIDTKGYHGIDERLTIVDYKRMIFFYTLIISDH